MNNNPLSEEDKKLGDHIRSLFDDAYNFHRASFVRLQEMQRAYEGHLPENWATYSQIYLPYVRTAVEQALPNIFNYQFPKRGMFSLIPQEPMPYGKVFPVTDYFNHLLLNQMKLKDQGLLTLKDAIKFNVGYGKVDVKVVTPFEIGNKVFYGAETPVKVTRADIGAPKEVIDYEYVHWSRVLPMPDGDSLENTSGVFYIDDVREDAFRAMYERDKAAEKPMLRGSVEEIIQYVRENNVSAGHFPMAWIMQSYSTEVYGNPARGAQMLRQMGLKKQTINAPVSVPILKCYFNREHIWMTPDGTIIKHLKDDVQTLRCPIIKACPVPDGGSHFPKGDVEAGRDAADGANVFKNALMDLVTYSLHPTTVINRMAVPSGDANLEPNGKIYTNGKIGDAVDFVQPPPMQQGMLGIGQDLEYQWSVALGQPMNLNGQGTAGVVRGGSSAFESLLQTTMARSKLMGAILQTGWLKKVIEHTVIMSQIYGFAGQYIDFDDVSNEFVQKTITTDDLMHSWNIEVNLDDKFNSTPSDKAMELQLYREVIKGNPRYDWSASDEWILGDQRLAKKLRASPEVMQAQMEQLQQMQAAQQQQQGGGLSPGEQAMQGGASQTGSKV